MRATPTGQRRVSVLIAEDHTVVSEGLALVLAPYFSVVGQVRTLKDLIPTLIQVKPQVVVLDVTFGDVSSVPHMKRAIAEFGVDSKFVILTAHESRAIMQASFAAGASCFVIKGSSGQDVRIAIEAALEGRRFISGQLAMQPSTRHRVDAPRQKLNVGGIGLTHRQIEVLLLMHQGLPRDDVAKRLDISGKGVEYNVAAIKDATGIPRLLELLRWVDEHLNEARAAIGQTPPH